MTTPKRCPSCNSFVARAAISCPKCSASVKKGKGAKAPSSRSIPSTKKATSDASRMTRERAKEIIPAVWKRVFRSLVGTNVPTNTPVSFSYRGGTGNTKPSAKLTGGVVLRQVYFRRVTVSIRFPTGRDRKYDVIVVDLHLPENETDTDYQEGYGSSPSLEKAISTAISSLR